MTGAPAGASVTGQPGLTTALTADALALGGQEAPVVDGLTGEQRVGAGVAQVWRTEARDEQALRRLATDPHSPAEFRCNAVVTDLDAFHTAVGVTEDAALHTPVEDRIRIW